MPRRQFLADLAKAVEGVAIANISNVQPGGDDGEFTFTCLADGQELSISVCIPEVSDYPSAHKCLIFVADNAPASVAASLDNFTDAASAKTITQILELVSHRLMPTDDDGSEQVLDSHEFDDFEAAEDADNELFAIDDDLNLDTEPEFSTYLASGSHGYHTEAGFAFRRRVRDDLLVVKKEGFRIGYMGGLIDGLPCYVSISIRISKLGISEEAMQAWQIEPSEYLVVMMHYPKGYKNMDEIVSFDKVQAHCNLGVRIGISKRYKPLMQEAIQSFNASKKEKHYQREADPQQATAPSRGFRNCFISGPLNDLLEQRFHSLLRLRYRGMSWYGAESFYDSQVHNAYPDASDDMYYSEDCSSGSWPKLVANDHITSASGQQHSAPLVSMQFVLRHFVRCTEFCLVCFRKMPEGLQAIKPYVCETPLCLYQYMSLGFGPSMEHEVMSQPKVVDLLISFCYASARTGRLVDFPIGLGLLVPPTAALDKRYASFCHRRYAYGKQSIKSATEQVTSKAHSAIATRYSAARRQLLFERDAQPCPVKNGDWIVLRVDKSPEIDLHFRIVDASYYPSVRLSEPVRPVISKTARDPGIISAQTQDAAHTTSPRLSSEFSFSSASFYIYGENFDTLGDQEKQQVVYALIELLPTVQDMRKYLLENTSCHLISWVDRLPPAAFAVLRWIIASNRSCLLQVDSDNDATSGRNLRDRVHGMAGWTQFRFAMGAPDKERRFARAVQESTKRLDLKISTLFAWHGSPIDNWHSIIREGFHFQHQTHGRVSGDGVYHSTNYNTSLGYSSYMTYNMCWASSELKIQRALALNEIVNAPDEYVSTSPHLVVAQLDWIKTRYLFVSTRDAVKTDVPDPDPKPLKFVEQDPYWTPFGPSGPLVIPSHDMLTSRRQKSVSKVEILALVMAFMWLLKTKGSDILKASDATPSDLNQMDDDEQSDATDEEDLTIFEDTDSLCPQVAGLLPKPGPVIDENGKEHQKDSTPSGIKMSGSELKSAVSKIFESEPKSTIIRIPLTDYVPGSLDYSTLPRLRMPSWASSLATNRLMRDFNNLVQVQRKGPLPELGWHIDQNEMVNIYQWIVELHSFESTLPLAKDMEQKNIKSIVLELRFGKDYPMSPPFVRVIRPRFLNFMEGGGGHVTSGGAMCMELLTNNGWSAVTSVESLLIQVRLALTSLKPRPARLKPGEALDYPVHQAMLAFIRACNEHGWTVPYGFREMALGVAHEMVSQSRGLNMAPSL